MKAVETQNIVYEDENLIALNKPPGVNFDLVLETRKDLISVHRLDKDTSGIILFAKNQSAADYLKSLFQNHKIRKTYLALVVGNVKNNRGVIDLPIGRSKKTPLKRVAVGERRGKMREAVTEFKVLKRFPPAPSKSDFESAKKSDFFPAGGFTLIEVYPETGRTHQIRSHFAAIGHPVACDKLYGGKNPKCPAELTRQFLHASVVDFTLPSGGRLRIEADLPEDLENAKVLLCRH